MLETIPTTLELNHRSCREYVENKFSVTQKVDEYKTIDAQISKSRFNLNSYIHQLKFQF